jgi:hypothetical protein
MNRLLAAALAAALAFAPSAALAARASEPPELVSESRFENPVQADPSGCYTEDSIHDRQWSGSGSLAVDLDFCGSEDEARTAGGTVFLVAVVGRLGAATITAPDGRQWEAIEHPSNRKAVIRCFSGFPAGSGGGHSLQGGLWHVEMSGQRADFWVTVRSASDLWQSCVGVTVDPTIY